MARGLVEGLQATVSDAVDDGIVQDSSSVGRSSSSGAAAAAAAAAGRGGDGGDGFRTGVGGCRRRAVRRRAGLEVDDPVLAPLVLLHRFLPVELLMADVALERAIVPVSALVNLKCIKSTSLKKIAVEAFLQVSLYVYPEISFLRVLLPAYFAREGLLPGVRDKVAFHGGHADEALPAHAAHGKDLRGALLCA